MIRNDVRTVHRLFPDLGAFFLLYADPCAGGRGGREREVHDDFATARDFVTCLLVLNPVEELPPPETHTIET
jgi:hypothetical protein